MPHAGILLRSVQLWVSDPGRSQASLDEAKKGSAEIVILAIVDHESHHGYEIAKLIEQRTGGSLRFTLASLYAFETSRTGRAAAYGALATVTRISGVMLAPAYAVVLWRRGSSRARALEIAWLALIPAGIMLATAKTAQIDQAAMQPLSLNNLFFHHMPGTPGYTLLTYFSLTYVLGALLAAAGIHAWSRRSWTHAIVIAFLPMVLVFGTWALIVVGRS